jgi:hypothetical protein
MDLRDLLEKTADTDFLREMIGFTALHIGVAKAPVSDERTHKNMIVTVLD